MKKSIIRRGSASLLNKGGMRGVAVGVILLVAMVILSLSKDASAFKLPDTGQTKCYRGVSPYDEISCGNTGQDGAYYINDMSFTGNGSTITDNNTGLTWQTEDDGTTRTWDQAVSYCASLSLAGSGWRLPSKKELITIVDYSIPYPGPTIKPIFTNTKQSNYWSSTTYAYNTSSAWSVYFYDGYVNYYGKSGGLYARCVRGGQ